MPTNSLPKITSRQLLGVLISLATGYAAAGEFVTIKEVRLEEHLGAKPVPRWAGGALLSLDAGGGDSIGISVFTSSGRKESAFRFALPGVRYLNVRCFSRANDGTIALGGSMVSHNGQSAPFLAMMKGDGSDLKIVRTDGFRAMYLAFANDGSLWVGGYEGSAKTAGGEKRTFEESLKKDAGAVRQFDRAGKQLQSILPQGEIGSILADLVHGETLFAFVGPELHWHSTSKGHYLRILPHGEFEQLTSPPLPNSEKATGFAINARGEVFACSSGKSTWSVSRLDPEARVWHSVRTAHTANKASLPLRVHLIGAEQDSLVSLSADAQFLQFLKWEPMGK